MSRLPSSLLSWCPWSIGVVSVASMLAATPASAQTCTKDADCPEHFTCEIAGQSTCPGKACPDGQKCPDPEPCQPSVIKQCQSPACTQDDECPKDMVCYAHSCVPRYVPPCQVASDCGDGFECVERMQCGCSGGGGVSRDGGMVSVQDASCMCQPTGESDCELQSKTCDSATDCPNGWTCEDDPSGAVCHSTGGAGASSGASGTAGTGTSSVDAGIGSGCRDEGSGKKVCLPPYYAWTRGGGKGDGTSEQGADGGGVTHAPDAGSPGTAGNATKHKSSSGCVVGASPVLSDLWPAAFALLALGRRPRARRRRAR